MKLPIKKAIKEYVLLKKKKQIKNIRLSYSGSYPGEPESYSYYSAEVDIVKEDI